MAKISGQTKIVFILFILIIQSLPITGEETANPNTPRKGAFKWAFIGEEKKELFFISGNTINKEHFNNLWRLYFYPIQNAYVYTFAITPGGGFQKIELVPFAEFDKASYEYNHYFTPSSSWPKPGTGCLEIHILIATERLWEIEKLMDQLNKADAGQETETRAENLYLLENEIKRLKAKKILGHHPIETPNLVAGSYRQMSPDILEDMKAMARHVTFSVVHEIIFTYECEETDQPAD